MIFRKKRFWLFALILIHSEMRAEKELYPPIEPYQTGFLETGDGHSIYWEESGSSTGIPVLFLHGGPGLGTTARDRSFFNPQLYRIILFDQRGCGKSSPFLSLQNNTTWDLVADIEKLRAALNVDQWLLFGGSWGSTLALTYAIEHPECVRGLILRGIFLCRPKEIQWFYQEGADHIFPDFWENYVAPIPTEERRDLVQAFYKRLTGSNPQERIDAVKAWAMWEGKTSTLQYRPTSLDSFSPKRAFALAKIECHYFIHNAFFNTDNWILENIDTIAHLPCTIIQGRYDIPCPMQSAWDLHGAWPNADFKIISNAGHSTSESGIVDALIEATDAFCMKEGL